MGSFRGVKAALALGVTLAVLTIGTVTMLEKNSGPGEGELIIFHNESLDAYSKYLFKENEFIEPELEDQEALVDLISNGSEFEVYTRCSSLATPDLRQHCFLSVGDALFILSPNQLSNNIRYCEGFKNKFNMETNRAPASLCVNTLIQHYLNEYGNFIQQRMVKAGAQNRLVEDIELQKLDIFKAFANFCLTLNTVSKIPCVQELAFFVSTKGYLPGSKDAHFEVCNLFTNFDLNSICSVGVGRSVITDRKGEVGVIDDKVFGSCLSIEEGKYRARCFSVVGSMDPKTKLEKVAELCGEDFISRWPLCRTYVGMVEYGRAHGVINDALADCNKIVASSLSQDCKIGVFMGNITLNYQLIEYKSLISFNLNYLKRESITTNSKMGRELERDVLLASIYATQEEDLDLLRADFFALRKMCDGFVTSCEEAVGVVYKNYNIEFKELIAFCERKSCIQGYREGLS